MDVGLGGRAEHLADEPTAELDAENRARVLEALRAAAAQGTAVLLTTHDDEVAARCDRVLHLQDGQLRPAT